LWLPVVVAAAQAAPVAEAAPAAFVLEQDYL
jgi:hypothetical protein